MICRGADSQSIWEWIQTLDGMIHGATYAQWYDETEADMATLGLDGLPAVDFAYTHGQVCGAASALGLTVLELVAEVS